MASCSPPPWMSTLPWSLGLTETSSTFGAVPDNYAGSVSTVSFCHQCVPLFRVRLAFAKHCSICCRTHGVVLKGSLLCHRGQMTAEEVCLIMWQLLHALKFLHSNNVWHRWASLCFNCCSQGCPGCHKLFVWLSFNIVRCCCAAGT